MKNKIYLIIWLLLVSSLLGKAAEADERLLPKDSPSKKITCRILPAEGGYGNVVVLSDIESGKTIQLYRSERWVETGWSPDSRWLFIIDHWDGHGASLHIFSVPPPIKGTKEWTVPKIYATPWPTRYNCKWKFVKWESSKGFAAVHCDYKSDSQTKKESWISRDFEIPIDYP